MAGYFCNQRFFVVLLFLALAAVNTVHGRHGTRVGFYSRTCPRAESSVRATVESHFRVNPSVAAGLLRMHFHDCFVRGCDASILVSGPNTERTSPANRNLNGFEVVDDAKEQLEGACPGVVSCADILALAARDSVVPSGGRSWKVPTGRRDGRVSKNSEPPLNLPSPNDTILVQKKKFARKGLKLKDLVTLTGGHTIGTAACQSFSDRFATNYSDPSINPSFLPQLRKLCPHKAPRKRVALDTGSQFKFDTSYFANMREGRGILRSDQALWTHASTRKYAKKYLASPVRFNVKFGKSMVKMSKIGVKTGTKGEIRRQCHAIN